MRVCAVASGTSADGLDVAVVDLGLEAGVISMDILRTGRLPWPDGLREALVQVQPPAATTVGAICQLDQLVGVAVADAVQRTVEALDRPPHLVVSPGHTVYHDLRDGTCYGTLQLGQPSWIAERTGLLVVFDLRSRDVAAGGRGGPLASTLDALWLSAPGGPRAALELGGIAAISVVGGEGEPVVAWDTGPGNCLLDVAAARVTDGRQTRDDDGLLAAAGNVRLDLLEALLEHPHFSALPPVSTAREAFSAGYLDDVLDRIGPDDARVDGPDLLATLTELTAVTVARAIRPYVVTDVVVSGGGVHNPTLMAAIQRHLGGVRLTRSDELGIPADSKEAVLWALLGFLTWHGVPGTTTATGALEPSVLGRVTPGAEPLRLPPSANAFHKRPRRLRVLTTAGGT
ncbi:MAG: anhydro-N-acetylmuramic acid kinase [Nocardioides sp.]